MIKMFIFLFSIISLVDLSVGQFVQNGQCDPNISLVRDFNVTSFLGTWYVTKRFQNPVQNGDCSTLEFAEAGGNLTVYNRAVQNNFLDEIRGSVSVQNGTAKLAITISGFSQPLDFWILPSATYESNSLGYACTNINATHRNIYIWQLSRTTTIGDLIEGNMNQTLVSLLGITIDTLPSVDHSTTACHVLPDIPAGQPVVLPGQCNQNIRVVQQFNASAFTGVWHEIFTYASPNEIGTCRRAQYQLLGSVVEVTNSEVVNQSLRIIRGNATISSSDNSAKLEVTLQVAGNSVSRPLWILDTDYTSYAVSYTCENLPNNQKRVNSWILSRSQKLTNAAQEAVDALIRSEIDLNNRFYVQTNQTDDGCFYFPEFVPNQPVIFPGQCDLNIKGIGNFNVTGYLGLWHNIESYHATSQRGTCLNARYTLRGDVVNVYNTQVIDQALDSITGTAVINSTDGTAQLLVTFPGVSNTTNTANYIVLDSDYDSYALVYSCSNINSNERRVTGFKLSRTKQLSNNASAAIERVMSQIPVLDQRYFVRQNQTQEGCFYYPEPQLGVPVVFPGGCEDNINVVQNFALAQFGGVWHQIQAYPMTQHQGHCVNHNLTSTSNTTFNVETTSVTDQLFEVFNSTGVSANGSARMTITLRTQNNQDNVIPFWILDTDYTNYALAYGCVNLPDDFRLVYSWKLSRTKQLSASNMTAIDNKITNITVLQNRYFEDIKQSDEACFSLPEIPKGDPIILNGQCDPSIRVVSNFNATAYLGNWRLIESYASQFQTGTCNRANYALGANNTVVVTNSHVINQTLNIATGSATLLSSGKLLVTFPGANRPLELWILDTDYSSYSLVYSCENIDTSRRRIWSWKMSRSRDLTPNAIENINRIVNSIDVLNNRYFEDMDQSDDGCFYYPTPDPTTPVVFPGQCDPNIRVVDNFNAAQYMNLWHNIESYPTQFQSGTCNNAFYSLQNNSVNVFNTQVINQRLDTINGVAKLASTDGSAKLTVNFPVPGGGFTESPYWVLDTDYTSYALVYSCVNLDDERRQVYAWTLSRTKQLTANATAAINRVTSTIPVLDSKYFVTRNQTAEGCFFFPDPKPGVVVEFPGQCANIQAVQNFNMSLFQGLWHEIEAYPKEQQTGQCINHDYTLTSVNSLNLISRNVITQELGVTNSTVTFASAQDTSGNLIITFISGGQVITIPYVVINTDYVSYALAYSCVNLPNDFRRVFSWKLSRNKQLSPAANTAINNAIANINVLDNRYYENINQTDDACFYLPTPVPGVPVEFEGQCDNNVAVVRNFSASDYMGRWLLIESYPAPQQDGTCNDATYSLNSNGNAVDVYNTKVLNQELVTINGTAVLATTDGSAKLLVTFPGTNNTAPYWVLDTDYRSYALVYSCQNIPNNRRRVYSWKLSRTPELTPAAIARIDQVINQVNVLNNRYFETVNRTDAGCFYFPTPGTNAPIFRGVCDENIPVTPNYNPTAYLGRWYDIQSYPSSLQTGTCNTVLYESGFETRIHKTQVLAETIDEMWGFSRNQFSSNIAKLMVRFTNSSTEYPYWILSTDYVSYSLVYTCVNLPDRRFQVNSWKLSRTKQLTANATAAIDRVINTIPVLNNRYYNNRNHTDQGCFYYPEPVSGSPVIFPGQCDLTIPAQANFNMSAFSGIWHDVQAYPDNRQAGQCINRNYNLASNNVLNLVTSSVSNQSKGVTNSTVTFTSSQDTSGKLTITDPSGNSAPFWILNTDYTGYALAYSCVNINATFRAVSSWKLSRNKQLSPASNTAINNAIANINVLDNRYYENINQADDACFYLPTPVPGVPVEFEGRCDDNVAVVRNFSASDYMGRWLLIESYPAPQQDGTCNDATYSLNSNGNAVDVYNTKVLNQELVTINGTAVLATTDGSAKLLVTFPGTNNTAPYWVLDTDYRSYALVYSCQNIPNNRRRVYSWKLSRTPELTPAAIASINQVISQVNVLNSNYFETVNRTDSGCFYLPPPGPNSPTFRGRCNDNIPVVQNFNVTAYLGTWYDIESYPVGFQFGTCPTATYEASNIGVNVYNTEVVAQRLSDIRGSAVLVSNDNSARLNVSFPVFGTNATTNSPYWVLATDYNNYALVYSCVDVGSEHKRVSSWKLSRTKTLTPASTNQINNFMSSVPVLNQRYFRNRGHRDEDCFYYPNNNGGPVVQSGQCDNNLNIVNNFDINAFAGAWFEISRFPSELQDGTCVSNNFTVNNQNFQLSKTIIYNERLTTIVGSATLPQDGRGIISVNLTNGAGATFATTFQVLDVVYNDFALLHNCRNLNSTHKQIYSWKLSRSQTGLSAAAVARINQVVSNTTELFEDYYDTTDQTARGCFHYPVFNELPSAIELIGPCNTTIRAKPNFNVTAYLGRWYEIASYPQAFQNGECARAQYSAGNNVVNVLNTQVVNRTLDARTATAVVASNDGSGLLEVTFVVGNVTNIVNYYVLETDYTSFSLVYSCQNLPNGNRRVSSWKLSRGKVLPSTAAPIIDNIINNTQGLDQDYYVPTSQSDEDCFYIPQVNKNEAPLFRGQCEVITGMRGFDVQKYLGWWHEIESYPTNSDVGACVSSNFRAVGNQYQVTDTNVFNNSAQVNTSTVAISADGRIRKTLSNGVVVDIWVLETDYETYSLLYSCENANSEYKRVWSAKHSKSRQLTAAAQQAMASIIARTETLEPQFYIPINQTNEACFHYPEQTGMQIILPGQCDPNIPVVQNFAPAKYSGTWYQIEKYPQRFENGTCIGARYTLDENTGVVDVLNWQVWNGTLDTIEGTATVNSTDGSAKLIVNLPIRGSDNPEPGMVSMELYVLKTDYITYSLAYSCVDINPFQRAVGVWKLSRTRTLLEESNSEINVYMNTRQELHQPYFETVEQNDDCEEPNSSYLVKSSIIIMLICSFLHLLY